jgi:hypothetical protein
MKVLNKLQYSIKLSEILQNHLHNPVSVKGINSAIDEYINKQELSDKFYNQHFKPELIAELFLNTDPDISSPDWFYADYDTDTDDYNHDIHLEKQYEGTKNELNFMHYDSIYSCPFPKTLDHFIAQCQDAGIELTWIPEIENKYFK